MLLVPAHYSPRKQDFLSVGNATQSAATHTALTPNASANTKGSYAQLIASTANDTHMLYVSLNANISDTTSKSYLVDIAIGAAASEVVIIANLLAECVQQFGACRNGFYFPIFIPAGTRISARAQCVGASGQTVGVKVICFKAQNAQITGGVGVETIGAVTATSKGTAVVPSATANTKGSYAQISASIANSWKGFLLDFDQQNTVGNFNNYQFDIATGAAASESIIIPDIQLNISSFPQGSAFSCMFPIAIPAGTRVAVRCASQGSSDITVGCAIHGVY